MILPTGPGVAVHARPSEVNPQIWHFFQSRHGGGPEILRMKQIRPATQDLDLESGAMVHRGERSSEVVRGVSDSPSQS